MSEPQSAIAVKPVISDFRLVPMAHLAAARPRHHRTEDGEREKALKEQELFWEEVVRLALIKQLFLSLTDCVQRKEAHFKELREMMQKFDTDKSGDLNAAELTICLKTYEEALRKGKPISQGGPPLELTPTDEEISLILRTVCREKNKVENAPEMEAAIGLWHSYVTNRRTIEQTFQEFDTNNSQKLELDQLARYLTKLNGGNRPSVLAQSLPRLHNFFKPTSSLELVICQRARTVQEMMRLALIDRMRR